MLMGLSAFGKEKLDHPDRALSRHSSVVIYSLLIWRLGLKISSTR